MGTAWRKAPRPVYWPMGYIIAIVLLLLVVPLVFLLLGRRTGTAGGIRRESRGVTVARPSSDQPTPRDSSRAPPGPEIPPG